IIGDTENMAKGLPMTLDESGVGLDKRFDVVLTFDYENLGRPIQESAAVLKSKLADVGLSPGDGKRLTILAHSMGGLVSRWFVEQLGGNEVVEHLVMCGTPNGGSPFGEVGNARKVLSALTTVAMNVPALQPLGPFVGFLLGRSKKVTVTLEQMDDDSEFIRTLNGRGDPSIPYTILAGNIEKYAEESDRMGANLLEKVGKGLLLNALHGSPKHDIAVGLDSIRAVSEDRSPSPDKRNVNCHHMNYFASSTGLEALRDVSW
ncbi:MAG: lipase family alpha/beta hydrolase, partial [Longimicrobiales bacterium]